MQHDLGLHQVRLRGRVGQAPGPLRYVLRGHAPHDPEEGRGTTGREEGLTKDAPGGKGVGHKTVHRHSAVPMNCFQGDYDTV